MSKYRSKERVERDGRLLYPEGYPIPEEDVDELVRQGFIEPDKPKPAKRQAAKKAKRK